MIYDQSLGELPVASPRAVVWRFMIDGNSQGKGIGRAALRLVIEHVRSKGRFSVLSLSYVPLPGSAEKFYLDLGFKPTGKVEDGEVELELSLNYRWAPTRSRAVILWQALLLPVAAAHVDTSGVIHAAILGDDRAYATES